MKTHSPAGLALSALLIAPGLVSQQHAKVGERVQGDYLIHGLRGHDGRTRLHELLGQPVVIASFRTHLVTGLHAARVATELHKKHAKNGLIILMEDRNKWRGGHPGDDSISFWLYVSGFIPWIRSMPEKGQRRDWPIQRSGPRGDRSMILIGVDGKLVIEGTTEEINTPKKKSDFRVRFAKLVAKEMSKRKKGWGKDAAAKKARSLAFGKDKLGQALLTLNNQGSDAFPERVLAKGEIGLHLRARIKSIAYLREQGRYIDASNALDALAKSVKGHPPWQNTVAALATELRSRENKRELKLDRKLTKILAPLMDPKKRKKTHADLLGALRVFASKNADSKVGERAKRVDHLVASSLSSLLGIRYDKLEEKAKSYVMKHGGK